MTNINDLNEKQNLIVNIPNKNNKLLGYIRSSLIQIFSILRALASGTAVAFFFLTLISALWGNIAYPIMGLTIPLGLISAIGAYSLYYRGINKKLNEIFQPKNLNFALPNNLKFKQKIARALARLTSYASAGIEFINVFTGSYKIAIAFFTFIGCSGIFISVVPFVFGAILGIGGFMASILVTAYSIRDKFSPETNQEIAEKILDGYKSLNHNIKKLNQCIDPITGYKIDEKNFSEFLHKFNKQYRKNTEHKKQINDYFNKTKIKLII